MTHRISLTLLYSLSLTATALLTVGCDCSGALPGGDAGPLADGSVADAASGDSGPGTDSGPGDAGPPVRAQTSELWYSVDDLLVRIQLDASNGSVIAFHTSTIVGIDLPVGQNAITMLDNGALVGARLSQADDLSYFYFLAEPPEDGADVTPTMLGVMPDAIMVEGLYSDCDGRLYAMDTGDDDTSSAGNRLLRFTGDLLAGDFAYTVISDLATADVADIDDMGPGINAEGDITDNPGLAIDTSNIYDFNYETGSGTLAATGGTWGIHALGGPLFTDGVSRIYVLSSDGELFEVDPGTFDVSGVLGTGPTPDEGSTGWSGLAGPLTDCDSGFLI